MMPDPDLVEAARFERDSREKHYPGQVASGQISADDATVDFQAWHCIAGFIATGHFQSLVGGGRGDRLVSWAEAEAAVDRAQAGVAAAIAAAGDDDAKRQRLTVRADRLCGIAALVRRQKRLIDSINDGLRRTRPVERKDAA